MNLQERSYNGQFTRPRPEVHVEEHASLVIIATPWGNRSGARRAIQSITEFFLAAKDDVEVTSPFQKLTCLSPMANNLRVAVMLANDIVYQEENRSEYLSGLELFVGAKDGNEFSFIQVGHPQIFLDRPGADLITTGCLTDLALDFSPKRKKFAPLPNTLLGVHSTTAPTIRTLRIGEGDRVVLLSHSWVPTPFFSLERGKRNLDSLSSVLANQAPDEPYWLGYLEP
ncbi:MAG: hypothetical protein H6624_18760 [Bdellovibrionaceae bacterium]|nr:hypothetical protein [Bdellovibrionales bacterium]MCB9086388.1 hypothetical protein [Pseudobdellovibrionaceae bacterium]